MLQWVGWAAGSCTTGRLFFSAISIIQDHSFIRQNYLMCWLPIYPAAHHMIPRIMGLHLSFFHRPPSLFVMPLPVLFLLRSTPNFRPSGLSKPKPKPKPNPHRIIIYAWCLIVCFCDGENENQPVSCYGGKGTSGGRVSLTPRPHRGRPSRWRVPGLAHAHGEGRGGRRFDGGDGDVGRRRRGSGSKVTTIDTLLTAVNP